MKKRGFKVAVTYLITKNRFNDSIGDIISGYTYYGSIKTAHKSVKERIEREQTGDNERYGVKLINWKIINTFTNEVIEEGE